MKRLRRGIAALGALTLVGYLLLPKPPLLDGVSFSQSVYANDGRLLRLTLNDEGAYRLRVPLSKIAPVFVEATLHYEDRFFYAHPGVNPFSVVRAFWHTYLSGGRKVGGSTITMQVARMRYGINSRTIGGKLTQMVRALELERHYSKDEILEAYLNLASYGRNIEGIGAASLIYFRKAPEKLSLHEALTLSIVPKSPDRRKPSGETDKDNTELIAARDRFLKEWVEEHPEDAARKSLLELPMTTYSPEDLPFAAPHFVDGLLAENPGRTELLTTIDLEQQRLLENRVRSYVERNKNRGINNASAMLVDFRDMGVRAVVGSADFFDGKIQGQVNGTRAKRSPGSTLKPFIYALGMEQSVLHPLTMLKDAPASFGAYNPENFENDFDGPITAKDALIRSRNLPAVQVARKLSDPDLYEFLKMAGVKGLRDEGWYGLALVLGGAEVTMEELVTMYAALPSGGVVRPLRRLLDEPERGAKKLLSKEVSFLTLDMLSESPRPGDGFRREWRLDDLPVYWKTGTSYGFRDAWTVAVFGPYVLAVWVGNFDGSGNPAFVGRAAAAPLLFEIVDAIKSQAGGLEAPFMDTGEITRVEVCAVSGQLPGDNCPQTVPTWFIPGKSPIKTCEIHREVIIDPVTGLRACPGVKKGKKAVYEFWPTDLLKIFKTAGIPRRVPPPYGPGCSLAATAASGVAPEISSPGRGLVYNVRVEAAENEKIAFTAVSDADSRELYWFVDEKFVGSSESGKPLFWPPEPGRFVVRVVDDHGRAAAREVKVVTVQ